MSEQIIVAPHPGPQATFIDLPTEVSIAWFGGAAGGGKSHCLLLDSLKYIDDPEYYAVYFRRTTKQLERTLWPAAKKLYMPFLIHHNGPRKGKFKDKANIQESKHIITFPSGAKVEFSYLEHDKDADLNFQGAELSGVYWD